MHFNPPLLKGQFLRRYKRFFADILLDDGTEVVAHCANTGSMRGLLHEGVAAYVTFNDDPKRKLKYSLELLGTSDGDLVGVNTMRPNKQAAEAIAGGQIAELLGYANLKHEVKYGAEGKSRIDILLSDDSKPDCYVEVKNVTLREDVDGVPTAQFPDAVTTRGQKHLNELADMVAEGHRAVMFFLVNRGDCQQFMPAAHIDKIYAETLAKVVAAGVEVVCYAADITAEEMALTNAISVKI